MLTYADGVALLEKARGGKRKLGNNTYLERYDDNTLAVVLHWTNIVLIHKDGTYTLDSNGWRTVTTKARINEFSPANVGARKFQWFVYSPGFTKEVEFYDGIRVKADGTPIRKYRRKAA